MSLHFQATGPMPRFCGDDELCSVIQALGPEEALGNFKLTELKAMCKRFQLKSTGDKHKLIGVIASHILAASSDRNSTGSKAQKRSLEISEADRKAAKRPCRDVAKHLLGIVQALGPEEALGNLTIPELKEHCRCFGLRPIGDKRSIISRIATHLLALDLEDGVQIESASSPTKEDQLLPSPALGSAVGEAVSSPEVTIHKVLAAAGAVTCNDGLDAACVAAERVSVLGLLARPTSEIGSRTKHVMDLEPDTPIKTVYSRGETTQLFKDQNLTQEAAVAEADALAADTPEREATMAAAWKQAVLCRDDTGNQVHIPRACKEATVSAAPTVPKQVDGGTGENIDTSPPFGMQTTHEQYLHSDISHLAGHPSVFEGTRDMSVVDLEKIRSVESDADMTLAEPTVLMVVDREICENINMGSAFGLHAIHEHRVPSSSADSIDHPCVGEEASETNAGDSGELCAAESVTAMTSAAAVFSMQGLNLAEQPHICEEIEETLVVDPEGLSPVESQAATNSAESTVPMHVNGTGDNYCISPPSGMQAMHEHQEHSGSAETLLEEEGEDVYEEQKEQDEQQGDRNETFDTLSDDIADQSSMMACEQGAATRATVQSLAANHIASDDAGKPSAFEELAETFIDQPEQVPPADSQAASLPSALVAAFNEDSEETGEKCRNVSVKMQTIGFNAIQVHPESAETLVEDDRNGMQEDREEVLHGSSEVEEGEVEQREESLDEQQEERDEEPWEEEQHTLIEKAKADEKTQIEGQSEPWKERDREIQQHDARDDEVCQNNSKPLQDEQGEDESQQQDRLQSLVCSNHGTRGGWTIDEYCSECDAIALQLASECHLKSSAIKNEEPGEGG